MLLKEYRFCIKWKIVTFPFFSLPTENFILFEQVYQFYFIPRAFSPRYNLCQVRHGSRDVGLLQGYDTPPGIQVRHDLVPREEPAFADLQGAQDETRSIH